MSLLRDMGDSLIKYGEILINKTEQITKTARVRIEIRKKEIEINNIKILIADHVIAMAEQNRQPDNEFLVTRMSSIKDLTRDIDELRVKLEEIKSQNSSTGQSDAKPGPVTES